LSEEEEKVEKEKPSIVIMQILNFLMTNLPQQTIKERVE
jgi:hypothetical protein